MTYIRHIHLHNNSQYGKCKITDGSFCHSEVQFLSENATAVTFVGYGCAKQLSDLWQLGRLMVLCSICRLQHIEAQLWLAATVEAAVAVSSTLMVYFLYRMKSQQLWPRPAIQYLHGKVSPRRISGGASTNVFIQTTGSQTWYMHCCYMFGFMFARLPIIWC